MEILQSISILLGCFVAIYGISAWRREHMGKRRIDLAEEVLALFYEAQDVVAAILSPTGYVGESDDLPPREKNSNEDEFESKVLDAGYLRMGRCRSRQDLFARIHALRYRFKVQNGQNAARPFDDLRSLTWDISKPFRRLARRGFAIRNKASREDVHREAEFRKIWDEMQAEDNCDEIRERATVMVGEMEHICRKIIERSELSILRRLVRALRARHKSENQ